jgi:hypothetical protein
MIDSVAVIRAIEAIPPTDRDLVCNRALTLVRDEMTLDDKKDIIETIVNIARGQRLSVCVHAQSFAFGNFLSDEIIKIIQEISHMPQWDRGDNVMLTLPFCEQSHSSFYYHGIIRSFIDNTSSQERKEMAWVQNSKAPQ